MKNRLNWLENPEIFRVNRLDAHSDHIWYVNTEAQKKGELIQIQSLNGTWKYLWRENPGRRPEHFYEEGFDDGQFGEIEVPGHVELQGYGRIQYINTMYPWDGHTFMRPPQIDWEYDPVSSYVKVFDLNKGLCNRRVCISFQGVEEAFYVWLNGSFIGYSEDSFTPSDFDLTPYIREKNNRLCVEVYKRSSAAWIEDQDFFRFSGIFRDVYLYAKPELHIEDLWIQAGLLDDYSTGTLTVKMKVSREEKMETVYLQEMAGCQAQLRLKDKAGKLLYEGLLEAETTEDGYFTSKQMRFEQIQLWSSDSPYLYKAEILLQNATGELVEIIPHKIGFRRFEIRDKIMLLNGKRLIIKGVNRHEWNPERGRSITREDMLADIEILKRNHINAVRTCHYPNQSLWYELCDEAGIYLMDEANLESHGSWQKMGTCEPSWNVPGDLPEWKACVVDRAASMLERDKNHVSVLFWSCGNESYAGKNILAMSSYFHEKDPSRLVHYEGVFWNREYDDISDVESRMYAKPDEIRAYLENDPQKPFLLCEYMHDMGNSLGGMESYIRLQEEFPMYQGGFIWDYIDQALYFKDKNGKRMLEYGGDFLDRPTDYAFSANGIVFADRTEKPALQEVAYWYQPKMIRMKKDIEKKHQIETAKAQITAKKTQWIKASKENSDELKVIKGDVNLGVKGKNFEILFSYVEAGPVSIVYEGKEWLYRAPRFALWRAATENDRGNGFPFESAMWIGADRYQKCKSYKIFCEKEAVTISYTFTLSAFPVVEATIIYKVDASGAIYIKARMGGSEDLPQLPCFGLRFILPYTADKIRWQGLSGETYPDRKRGGTFGIYESKAEITKYLVPQENGCHVDTYQMEAEYEGKRIRFVYDKEPFAFSALPVTAHEMEAAFHKEEMLLQGRTIISIYGAMRGVGGIDSWGADVEAAYQIPAGKDLEVSFIIFPEGD